MHARLLLDRPAPGIWNMAVDESILRSAASRGCLTLRIYHWDEPTLSLGYFQKHCDRENHPPSRHCPVVRRTTGGGAILHDREVTYSLAVPIGHRTDRQTRQWYHRLHQAWVATLAVWDIAAHLCGKTDMEREGEFLCFQRRSQGDLLVGAAKIGGSAQRRHHQAILQHGSLLFDRSPAAPELPGIQQLAEKAPPSKQWLERWIGALAEELSVAWQLAELSREERQTAAALATEKYGSDEWTLRR